MIARLFVLLPFHLTVPEGEQFPVFEYEDTGNKVRVFPPLRSERAPALDGSEQLKIDGVLTFQADVLRIDFSKDTFERGRESACDPPYEVIGRAVNSFLVRLRLVARAPQVRPQNFPWATWRLQYLNDDDTELEKDEKLLRGRGTFQHSFSWIALNKKVWDDIYNLQPDYQPPPWESLLLDAYGELPSIGPSVVLATTALEVFISQVLDELAAIKKLPKDIWRWINERRREPTIEEQYGDLLKFLVDHTLKEEQKLWESFLALKEARNTFVHGGNATIKNVRINAERARELVDSASQVISKVKEWLPQELHWPEFKHVIQVEILKQLQ